jgi:hypothetical protein
LFALSGFFKLSFRIEFPFCIIRNYCWIIKHIRKIEVSKQHEPTEINILWLHNYIVATKTKCVPKQKPNHNNVYIKCVYFDLCLPYYLNTLPEYTTSPLGFNVIRLVESTGSWVLFCGLFFVSFVIFQLCVCPLLYGYPFGIFNLSDVFNNSTIITNYAKRKFDTKW